MKRIEFIAPVEAMRGNLSGSQVLEYPEQNNAAFDAPAGKRSYARNYQSRFIGAKRASDGLKYFQVRTKSAIGLTAKSKMAMALLGATGAIRAALKKMSAWDNIVANYEIAKAAGQTNAKSVAKWVYDAIYETLKVKGAVINFAVTGGTATRFKNPFVKSAGATASDIDNVPSYILIKFWSQLANNPIAFTIDGMKGIAHSGDVWDDLTNAKYNVLGCDPAGQYAAIGGSTDSVIFLGENPQLSSAAIVASAEYVLGTQVP